MFPITIDVVSADRSRRLEGSATGSPRRPSSAGSDAENTENVGNADHSVRHHRAFRPVFGR